MLDPFTHAIAASIKIPHIIAGFFGAVISLSFLKEKTLYTSCVAVLTGAISAQYATPTVIQYFPSFDEGFAAFIIGLISMNMIAGIIKLSEIFKNNPAILINKGDKQ